MIFEMTVPNVVFKKINLQLNLDMNNIAEDEKNEYVVVACTSNSSRPTPFYGGLYGQILVFIKKVTVNSPNQPFI